MIRTLVSATFDNLLKKSCKSVFCQLKSDCSRNVGISTSTCNYTARHLNPTKSNQNGKYTDLVFLVILTDFKWFFTVCSSVHARVRVGPNGQTQTARLPIELFKRQTVRLSKYCFRRISVKLTVITVN